jgi:hypothetical protein
LSQFSGTKRMRPLSTASMAGAASGATSHVPLVGEVGLDHRAAAVAARHHELVRLDLLDQAGGSSIGDDALARLEAIEAAQGGRRVVVERASGVRC